MNNIEKYILICGCFLGIVFGTIFFFCEPGRATDYINISGVSIESPVIINRQESRNLIFTISDVVCLSGNACVEIK